MSDENTQVILQRLDRIKVEIKAIKLNNDAYQKTSDTHIKASDQVANLAVTVITALAAVTGLSPAVNFTR